MFLSLRKKTKIANLVPGKQAVIKGSVQAKKELTLPGTDTRCVYFDRLTETYRQGTRGKGRPLWFPDQMDRKCAGFFVRDDTGMVWVEGDPQSLSVKSGHLESGFLDKRGKKRYSATLIGTGDIVTVRGLVVAPRSDTSDCAVIQPNQKGVLEIAARPREQNGGDGR